MARTNLAMETWMGGINPAMARGGEAAPPPRGGDVVPTPPHQPRPWFRAPDRLRLPDGPALLNGPRPPRGPHPPHAGRSRPGAPWPGHYVAKPFCRLRHRA